MKIFQTSTPKQSAWNLNRSPPELQEIQRDDPDRNPGKYGPRRRAEGRAKLDGELRPTQPIPSHDLLLARNLPGNDRSKLWFASRVASSLTPPFADHHVKEVKDDRSCDTEENQRILDHPAIHSDSFPQRA
jgi:hypothetical protein